MDYPARPDRRPVELIGHALLPDGSIFDASLIDLSYEGCRIKAGQELRPGDRLKLGVFRLGLIEAEVRWYEDGEAGLTFAPIEAAPKTLWPRRSDRVQVTASVSLRKPGKATFSSRVFDVSPEGCKVEFVDRPVVNDRVWIKFDGIENLESEVCWVDDFVMGVNFAKPMHPAVFDLLVERLGGAD